MSDDTKALVRSTALRLFRERGYAATTMRAIAQEAGVATGNAYYHFASKDHLVQELYLDVTREQAAAARAVLARLAARVGGRLCLVSVGGIADAAEARRRLEAGATLVQAYTGFVYGGPAWPGRVNAELASG